MNIVVSDPSNAGERRPGVFRLHSIEPPFRRSREDCMIRKARVTRRNRARLSAVSAAIGVVSTLAFAGCSKSEAAPSQKVDPPKLEPAAVPAATTVDGKNFKLEIKSAGPCKVGDECKVVVLLDATGEFHINKEYPYKFTVKSPAPELDYLGKEGDANCAGGKLVFSKCAGDFKQEGESKGVLTIRFKPSKAGATKVGGQYKMSVCSAQNCQLESHDLALPLEVAAK